MCFFLLQLLLPSSRNYIDCRAQQINGFSMWRNSISISAPPREPNVRHTHVRCFLLARLLPPDIDFSTVTRAKNLLTTFNLTRGGMMMLWIHFEQSLYTRVSTSQELKKKKSNEKKNFMIFLSAR